MTRNAMTTRVTATPIPAFAPVLRPPPEAEDEDGVDVADDRSGVGGRED